MHKSLLAAGLLAAFPWVAYAQTPDAPAATQAAAAAATPATTGADSAVAVRNLFHQRRNGGAVFTAIGSAFTLAILRGATSADASGNAAGAVTSIAVLGGLPAGLGIGKLARFSHAREKEVLQAYAQGKPLPKAIRRRLKRKHFQE